VCYPTKQKKTCGPICVIGIRIASIAGTSVLAGVCKRDLTKWSRRRLKRTELEKPTWNTSLINPRHHSLEFLSQRRAGEKKQLLIQLKKGAGRSLSQGKKKMRTGVIGWEQKPGANRRQTAWRARHTCTKNFERLTRPEKGREGRSCEEGKKDPQNGSRKGKARKIQNPSVDRAGKESEKRTKEKRRKREFKKNHSQLNRPGPSAREEEKEKTHREKRESLHQKNQGGRTG